MITQGIGWNMFSKAKYNCEHSFYIISQLMFVFLVLFRFDDFYFTIYEIENLQRRRMKDASEAEYD